MQQGVGQTFVPIFFSQKPGCHTRKTVTVTCPCNKSSLNPIQPGGGGGGGRGQVPALALNVNIFFNIEENATKLSDVS